MYEELKAKQKLNLILRSNKSASRPIQTGDTVQVFIKHHYEKGGRWSTPRIVLSVYSNTGAITVTGSSNSTLIVVFEYVRLAIMDEHLADSVLNSIDDMTYKIEEELNIIDVLQSDSHRSSQSDACRSHKADNLFNHMRLELLSMMHLICIILMNFSTLGLMQNTKMCLTMFRAMRNSTLALPMSVTTSKVSGPSTTTTTSELLNLSTKTTTMSSNTQISTPRR